MTRPGHACILAQDTTRADDQLILLFTGNYNKTRGGPTLYDVSVRASGKTLKPKAVGACEYSPHSRPAFTHPYNGRKE